ncbi:MAG: glycerol-3-phosphate 1-O-acyltransferase PlsY [Gemmatimonadetes bacterium]|nr:glycerol-3-phosphate 1-O-acyltransferase PlsY [Gemmatimonadota bacterium]
MTYLFLALSYVFGATPTSYWVGKAVHGIDLRQHGSGNLGATNAFRILGWKSALPVILVDVSKGFVPVWLFPGLCGASFGWTLAFGAAAIVGHMFSFWVGFKGGKGVGTSAGVFLALAPWAVLGGFLVWLALMIATRYVSVASMGAAVTLPVFVAFTAHAGGATLTGFTVALAIVVVWAHRSNIRRLIRGEENRFGRTREAGKKDGTTGTEGAA